MDENMKKELKEFATWLSNHNALSDCFGTPIYNEKDVENIVDEYLNQNKRD